MAEDAANSPQSPKTPAAMARAMTAPNLKDDLNQSGMMLDSTTLPSMAATVSGADGFLSRTTKGSTDYKFLQVGDAWNATHSLAPSFTMKARPRHGVFGKPSVETEFGPDVSKSVDRIKPVTTRHWSLLARPKKGMMDGQGGWVPAPGEYKNPTTVLKKHPTIPTAGRGWHWGSENRSPPMRVSCAPDPTRYDVKPEMPPAFSIKSRIPEIEDKAPRKIYDVTGTTKKGGIAKSPSWGFTNRPPSSFSKVGAEDEPGPGTHPLPKDIGRQKRAPSWGFGKGSRWGKEPEMRPY
eukprot:TRINITY_DN81445_c0_g1_i1.p1 TRINITY_DN81445_c0_g1~~TRINITY_DN81445_c0_g1_i1.p1  ORF type:complete len:311 (+),score=49.55 TRINITY_DN81445_c0_g1_i1:56-934(+)